MPAEPSSQKPLPRRKGDSIPRLTEKQRSFVEQYAIDLNGKQAVLRSLYETNGDASAARLATTLLRVPHVLAEVRKLVDAKRATRTTMITEEYVLSKIVNTIARAENADKPDNNAVLRGCELLARTLGMLRDRQEITGKDGGPIETQEVQESADAFLSAISRLSERNSDK